MNTLFYYIETFVQALPEALNYFRAVTPEGFLEATDRLVLRAIDHLEESANHLRNSSEDTITVSAIGFLNRYGIQASYQTNSRGHVDIFIRHSWQPGFVVCGEAKIWRGVAYHIGGMAQVLQYTTGRYPACFVLEYVKSGALAAHIQTLRAELDARLPQGQNAPCAAHPSITQALLTTHDHNSGTPIRMLHAGVNLA